MVDFFAVNIMTATLLITLAFTLLCVDALEYKYTNRIEIPSFEDFSYALYNTTYSVSFNIQESSVLTHYEILTQENFNKKQKRLQYQTITTFVGYNFKYSMNDVQNYVKIGNGVVLVVENFGLQASTLDIEVVQQLNLPAWLIAVISVTSAAICCCCVTCFVGIIFCLTRRKKKRYYLQI
jgi:hypothetical protein